MMALPAALEQELAELGYTGLRRVPAGQLCGLLPFVFTAALVVEVEVSGYGRRYCYEHQADANAALQAWDGQGHPGGPWVKCKGAGIDLLNPALEAFTDTP